MKCAFKEISFIGCNLINSEQLLRFIFKFYILYLIDI